MFWGKYEGKMLFNIVDTRSFVSLKPHQMLPLVQETFHNFPQYWLMSGTDLRVIHLTVFMSTVVVVTVVVVGAGTVKYETKISSIYSTSELNDV